MGANMKEFCNINEKFESVKTEFFQCVAGYKTKRETINAQIDKLKKYAEKLKEGNDKYIIIDTIHLLEQEYNDIDQILQVASNFSNELKSLSTLKILEENIEWKKANGLKVLEAQEQVRKKIASELHDSAVQNLTGLTYKVELCTRLLETDPTRVKLELQIMLSSIKSIIADMRSTIYNLRPVLVGSKSLDTCINKFLENLGISYPNINFKYEVIGKCKEVKETYGLTILRIIQEACQNAARHSNAQYIKVEVEYSVDKLNRF